MQTGIDKSATHMHVTVEILTTRSVPFAGFGIPAFSSIRMNSGIALPGAITFVIAAALEPLFLPPLVMK